MAKPSIESLDLNLLKVLKILGEELNTKRAAIRLNLAQPSVSYSLKRLRATFDDELFVRSQYGLTPTIRGQELLNQLPDVFQSLERFIHGDDEFVPSAYVGDIRIVLNDFMNQSFSAKLYHLLHKEAPNASISITGWKETTIEDLKLGLKHVGINYVTIDAPKEIKQIEITEESFMVCVRKDHPLLNIKPSIHDIARYPLIIYLAAEMNTIKSYSEQAVLEAGHTPYVMFRTDILGSALEAVANSDGLLPLPSHCVDKIPSSLSYFHVSKSMSAASGKIALFISHKNKSSNFSHWLLELLSNNVVEQIDKTKSLIGLPK